MLYEFVFCAGWLKQCFNIFSVLPRRAIPCSANKTISDFQLTQPSTLVVEFDEGDIIELLQV